MKQNQLELDLKFILTERVYTCQGLQLGQDGLSHPKLTQVRHRDSAQGPASQKSHFWLMVQEADAPIYKSESDEAVGRPANNT